MSQWEKVGKGKSKTKSQKQEALDKMPKQNYEVSPLEVTVSAFEALDIKSKKVTTSKQPLQDRSNGQNSPKGGGKKNKKPKKSGPPRFKHDNFEDAISEVVVAEVYERAKKIKGNSVWQKEIITLINEAISCPEEDPTFSSRSDVKFPLSKVPEPIKVMMKDLYVDGAASDQIRQIIFDHCMLSLWDLVERDVPTWGYRLCIQVLAWYAPGNCVDNLERHASKIQNGQNNLKKCLSCMWAVGQIGVGDVKLGMQVWLTVMMPFLGVKKLAGYVISYLEDLLNMSNNPQKDLAQMINADQFVQIMMWTYDQSNGLESSARNKLKSLFRSLCVVATSTQNMKLALFRKFLRTNSDEIAKVHPQFVEVAWECTKANPECFESWANAYVSSLPQTKMLLEYVEGHCKTSRVAIGFQNAVYSFERKNSEAASESSPLTSAPEFKAIRSLCQKFIVQFEKKSSSNRSLCSNILFSTVMILLAIGIGLFIRDVQFHGNVENSITYKTLKRNGVLDLMLHIRSRMATFTGYIYKWLQQNIPYYWSVISDVFGPYVLYIASCLSDLGSLILRVSAPLRSATAYYTEQLLVLVDNAATNAGPYFSDTLNRLSPYFVKFSRWLDAKIVTFFSILNGEIGWCCIKDSALETATYLYQLVAESSLAVWSYVVYSGKQIRDYVTGENMV